MKIRNPPTRGVVVMMRMVVRGRGRRSFENKNEQRVKGVMGGDIFAVEKTT